MAASDELLLPALEAGANGGIFGVCSVFPQLLLGIYRTFKPRDFRKARALQSKLQEFVSAVSGLPTPWGIKVALDREGFPMGLPSWQPGDGGNKSWYQRKPMKD
jgi:dihydrodipicolinate synthase/N-acetylneuraminate lyase